VEVHVTEAPRAAAGGDVIATGLFIQVDVSRFRA
jgi:hypothetical protein